jgi:hypothetical protein
MKLKRPLKQPFKQRSPEYRIACFHAGNSGWRFIILSPTDI